GEKAAHFAGFEVRPEGRWFQDLRIPLQESEFLPFEGVRANGKKDDGSPLHDELVHMLDEHEGLQEAVIDDQVLEAVQEHDALAIAVLDELLDHLRERPDRGRVVEVLARRVAEPDQADLGKAAFSTDPLRVLAGDAKAWDLLSHKGL